MYFTQRSAGCRQQPSSALPREELQAVIRDYQSGIVPLVVPLTLIRHYVRKYDVPYLRGQLYLEPHPKELMPRNHV